MHASATEAAAFPRNPSSLGIAACFAADQVFCRPDAATRSAFEERARPPVDASPGLVVSLQDFLEDGLVELRLGQQLLQPLVLLIEFFQPLRLFGFIPPYWFRQRLKVASLTSKA